MADKKKILLVDDHPLFRAGLKSLLLESRSFQIIGEAGDGQEAIRLAKTLKPDLVLLDISLPDKSGIEVTRELKNLFPEILILIVSMHAKIDFITEAFRAGALGYVIKESAAERLVQGLETVSRGDYFLDSSLSHKVVEKILGFPTKEAKITDREIRQPDSEGGAGPATAGRRAFGQGNRRETFYQPQDRRKPSRQYHGQIGPSQHLGIDPLRGPARIDRSRPLEKVSQGRPGLRRETGGWAPDLFVLFEKQIFHPFGRGGSRRQG